MCHIQLFVDEAGKCYVNNIADSLLNFERQLVNFHENYYTFRTKSECHKCQKVSTNLHMKLFISYENRILF